MQKTDVYHIILYVTWAFLGSVMAQIALGTWMGYQIKPYNLLCESSIGTRVQIENNVSRTSARVRRVFIIFSSGANYQTQLEQT